MLKLIAAAAIAFVAALPAVSQSASAAEILLRSSHSGKFVGVSGGRLAANASNAAGALRLDMVRLDGNRVAFRALSDNSYVRAGVGQGTFLATGSPHIRGWETFQLMNLGNGAYALRSVQNGKLVRAGVGRGSMLAAVSTGKPRAWEIFNVVPAEAIGRGGSGRPSGSGQARHIAGDWRVVSVAAHQTGFLTQLSPQLSRASRLTIQADGALSATVGCNRISGSISQNGGRVETGRTIITRMACPQRDVMSAERSLTGALDDATSITQNGPSITLYDASRQPVLVLRRR